MSSAKTEGNAASGCGYGCLLVLVLISGGLYLGYNALWGELEGTIRTDDCRTRIELKEQSADTWFKKFTCSYRKTNSGAVMDGYCEAVDTTSAGSCDAIYFCIKNAQPQ
jgi:hypothetical protein